MKNKLCKLLKKYFKLPNYQPDVFYSDTCYVCGNPVSQKLIDKKLKDLSKKIIEALNDNN